MWGYERHRVAYSLEQCPPASITKRGSLTGSEPTTPILQLDQLTMDVDDSAFNLHVFGRAKYGIKRTISRL